jgi:homoserine kinase
MLSGPQIEMINATRALLAELEDEAVLQDAFANGRLAAGLSGAGSGLFDVLTSPRSSSSQR